MTSGARPPPLLPSSPGKFSLLWVVGHNPATLLTRPPKAYRIFRSFRLTIPSGLAPPPPPLPAPLSHLLSQTTRQTPHKRTTASISHPSHMATPLPPQPQTHDSFGSTSSAESTDSFLAAADKRLLENGLDPAQYYVARLDYAGESFSSQPCPVSISREICWTVWAAGGDADCVAFFFSRNVCVHGSKSRRV